MTKSSGTILAAAGRPEGRGAGTGPRTSSRRQFMALGASSFQAPGVLLAAAGELDTAYINARVWTGVHGAPIAKALGIKGSRIAAVDEAAVKAKTGKRTRVVDLEGAFVVPGFVDGHVHFLLAAATLTPPDLRHANTREEFVRRVAEAAKQLPDGEWMRGGSWDAELWGGELPTRQWIDAVTPHTPVALARLDQHMWLVNSLALRLAGIDKNTPEPAGGRIIRDANGEPTGVVIDKAQGLLERVIPPPSDAVVRRMMKAGIEHGLRNGVTQAHSMGLDWDMHNALLRLRKEGETDMRFFSLRVPLSGLGEAGGHHQTRRPWRRLGAVGAVSRRWPTDRWARVPRSFIGRMTTSRQRARNPRQHARAFARVGNPGGPA